MTAALRRAIRVDVDHVDTAVADLYVFADTDRLIRYLALHLTASVIAALALASDQAAVVIGAMLLAPLMTPVLGLAAALVRADTRDAARAGVLVGASVAITLTVSWLTVALAPSLVNTFFIPDELLARTEPNLADLFIALAAGAAGAFATVRPDVSASLPGVAVAVALVPPLASAGLLFGIDESKLAVDALLLFVTNVLAIVAAAAVVFAGAGIRPGPGRWWHNVRIFAALTIGLVSVAVPLKFAFDRAAEDTAAQEALQDALSEIRRTLDDTARTTSTTGPGPTPRLTITDASLDEDVLTIRVESPVEPKIPEALSDAISEDLGRDIEIRIEWVQLNVISSLDATG